MTELIRTRDDLRKYQVYLSELIKEKPFNFLAVDMGLGKTASTLKALRDLLDQFVITRVLIIAPLLVAETVWPDEIAVWDFARPLTYELLTGDAARREYRARIDADIHIINRELVPWLVKFWGDDWPYDMVVIDEFQSFKNPRKRSEPSKKAIEAAMQRARDTVGPDAPENKLERALQGELRALKRNLTRFGAMCRARGHIERMVGLTGTPSPNGLVDLWAPTYLLDQGQRLGANYRAFTKRWFTKGHNGYGIEPRPTAHKEIMRELSDIMVSMRSEDYIELPDIVFNTVHAPLPKKAMEEYRRFKKTLVSEMYEVNASSLGVLANKLLQFANGSMYQEDGNDIEIHDAKLQALENIVEEAAGEPILVAYSFKFDLKRILKKFPKAVLAGDDPSIVKKWNAGKIPMLVGHPASMGHGLNLQHGGHIAAWYGFNYSLEYYKQFIKRLHRSGQTKKVIIHHIVAPGTDDERVLAVLNGKESTQNDVLEAVRISL